jgi:hypothetical protein
MAALGVMALVPGFASGKVVVSPAEVTFPQLAVGGKSAPVAVTLTKDCTGAENTNCLPIPTGTEGPTYSPSISVEGPFSQTNDCPAALGAGPDTTRSCTINVRFEPKAVGSAVGALLVGPGGFGASLSGKGVPSIKGKKCKKKAKKKNAAAAKKKCKKKKK